LKESNRNNSTELVNQTVINVRFSEIDSLHIVWHGHFLRYFEDGREAFGHQYKISYLDFYHNGLLTPVVDISCHFKKQLVYGDKIIIETRFVNTDTAKIIFEYKIFKNNNQTLAAIGKSVQVFLNLDGELILTNPEYFLKWKIKHGLIKL